MESLKGNLHLEEKKNTLATNWKKTLTLTKPNAKSKAKGSSMDMESLQWVT
jgi:hypothetical protein